MTIKQSTNGHFGAGIAYKPAAMTVRGYVTSLSQEKRNAQIAKCESNLKRAIRNRNPSMVLKYAAKLNRLSTE